jgi:hypothetical protein
MIAEAEKAVEEDDEDDEEILSTAHGSEKAAMHRWKAENPDKSLKGQRRLLARGRIQELPWMQYLEPEADFEDKDAAEALKWAQEQLEESKKKDTVTWMEREGDHQIKKSREI